MSNEQIYLYRRKGLSDYATCDKARYVELSQHKLFETMVCYASADTGENEALRKDLESHKRMLLSAAVSIGAIGEALGAEMDDDPSELEGLAAELRKDADRFRFIIDCPIRTMVALSRKAADADFDLASECDRIMSKIASKKIGD